MDAQHRGRGDPLTRGRGAYSALGTAYCVLLGLYGALRREPAYSHLVGGKRVLRGPGTECLVLSRVHTEGRVHPQAGQWRGE